MANYWLYRGFKVLKNVEDKSWMNMVEGEEVIWSCHPTILMYIPEILGGLILGLVGVLTYLSGFWQDMSLGAFSYSPLALTALAISYITYQLVHRWSISYVATTEKVVRKDGIIRRYRNPVNYTRVSNIKAKESVLERVVSFIVPKQDIGDILIHTSDDNMGDLKFKNVGSVHEGVQILQEQLSGSEGYRTAPTTEN